MKNLTKALLMAIFSLVISINSFSQNLTARDKALEQAALIKKKLSLSDDVADKVQTIELKYVDQKGETIIDKDGKKTTLTGELKKLLTADQYKMYQDLINQQKEDLRSQKEANKLQKEQDKMMKEMSKSSGSSHRK